MVLATLVQGKRKLCDLTIIFFTSLCQGKGIFGNFEKSKLDPIPNKKDNVSLESLVG